MPVEGRPHGEHGTAAEQALVPRTVLGRGLKVDRAAGAGEVGGLRELSAAGRRWRQSCVLRVGAWEKKAPSSGLWSGTGAMGASLLCFAPFSSPAAKFDCLPGASKNSFLRSLASCPSVPAPVPPSPRSGILERMT